VRHRVGETKRSKAPTPLLRQIFPLASAWASQREAERDTRGDFVVFVFILLLQFRYLPAIEQHYSEPLQSMRQFVQLTGFQWIASNLSHI